MCEYTILSEHLELWSSVHYKNHRYMYIKYFFKNIRLQSKYVYLFKLLIIEYSVLNPRISNLKLGDNNKKITLCSFTAFDVFLEKTDGFTL